MEVSTFVYGVSCGSVWGEMDARKGDANFVVFVSRRVSTRDVVRNAKNEDFGKSCEVIIIITILNRVGITRCWEICIKRRNTFT